MLTSSYEMELTFFLRMTNKEKKIRVMKRRTERKEEENVEILSMSPITRVTLYM